jgi:hypothetical protein
MSAYDPKRKSSAPYCCDAQGAVVAAPPVEPNAPWRVAALRTHRHGYNNLSQRGSHQAH